MADLSPYVEEVLAEIEELGGDAVTVKANLGTFAGAESVVAKAPKPMVVLMYSSTTSAVQFG